MKFGLFYEAQTPRPLDSDDWEPGQEARRFHETLQQIQLADRVGFDYVWVAEHHFTGEYCHTSASDLLLAALATTTTHIRLGTGIVQMIPRHNHPARVAERIATLDILSNGRAEFGTGEGSPAEWGMFVANADTEDKKAMWAESTRECLRMMSCTPYPGYRGSYLDVPRVNVVPKPAQQPYPPVWVAASAPPTATLAGHLGIGALIISFIGPEDTTARVDAYWEQLQHNLEPLGQTVTPAVGCFVMALLARTDEEARARERDGNAYFNYAIRESGAVARNPDRHLRREFQRLQDAGTPPVTPGDRPFNFANAPSTLLGSPDTVRSRVRAYEGTNVDIFSLAVQVGDRRHEDIMESLELFGTRVIPEFKERQAQHDAWRARQLQTIRQPINSTV